MTKPRGFIVTIDGPAGVGKSTVAKRLAKRLGLLYVDTGATYRTLALAALEQGIDVRRPAAVARLSRTLPLKFDAPVPGTLRVLLGDKDVTRTIRTERVTDAAAIIAQHTSVRRAMVQLQRRLAHRNRVVIEGRDTGSVVFPDAPYKFFLTATATVRARRRRHELLGVQGNAPKLPEILKQLQQRDGMDRRRRVGPLVKPRRAVVVDTSNLTADQVVARLLRHLPSNGRHGP